MIVKRLMQALKTAGISERKAAELLPQFQALLDEGGKPLRNMGRPSRSSHALPPKAKQRLVRAEAALAGEKPVGN